MGGKEKEWIVSLGKGRGGWHAMAGVGVGWHGWVKEVKRAGSVEDLSQAGYLLLRHHHAQLNLSVHIMYNT